MNTLILTMLAETFIHPGSGQGDGAIDQPVAREKTTGIPFFSGSAMKGAWRDYARQHSLSNIEALFGEQENAGQLLFSDARLLLLPVRSLTGNYKWITSPYLLERISRDMRRAGKTQLDKQSVDKGKYIGKQNDSATENKLYLEERSFAHQSDLNPDFVISLQSFVTDDGAKNRLSDQLVILHDDDLVWFCKNALAVTARNHLEEETKQSQNLWYEETLPPDTVMYELISERNNAGSLATFKTDAEKNRYLQAGGNETVGQGWFHVGFYDSNAGENKDGGKIEDGEQNTTAQSGNEK